MIDHLGLVQDFIERCERTHSNEDLASTLQGTLEALGFRYFACWSHVDLLDPPADALVLHNYPREWVRIYRERKLYEIDPVILHAERSALPFFWDEPAFLEHLSAPQKKILADGSSFGLTNGYTVPIHLPWTRGPLRASCSVVPGTEPIHVRSYFAVQLMATCVYCAASRRLEHRPDGRSGNSLSRRERQCLELAAQGKSDWVIGRLLGLSESTVHKYIERAKRRLGVGTRVQAIIEALKGRQISFGEGRVADGSPGSDEADADGPASEGTEEDR